ncbi:helix-turn-helix domain-containing protein [Sphingobacterium sp. Mn56C]|uniref:helix-turn-helix domain-containing protein n=1 Tax=Sphingobacterium sp. Mn56C TaxID=3395261 RepID=UPI003BBD7E44
MTKSSENKRIEQLKNMGDILPVFHESFDDVNIQVVSRKEDPCKNYLSPNRRDFYKILYFSKGLSVLTIGMNTYYLDLPSIIFLHPNEIVSWKNLGEEADGYFVLFKKKFIDSKPILKLAMEQYELFSKPEKNVIQLQKEHISLFDHWLEQMIQEMKTRDEFTEDRLQTYIQMVMIESVKVGNFSVPSIVSEEYRQVHDFFQLLEEETSQINVDNPIKMKTAKEFAHFLAIHPNQLNTLLKRHTGQNVSTHIKTRLLEETKAMLIQTDLTMQEIGYSIGFADQPNFTQFFKKNIGLSPQAFRKNHQQSAV